MIKKKLVIFSATHIPQLMSGAEQMSREICDRLGSRYNTTLITAWMNKDNKKYEKREGYNIIRVGIGHWQVDKILYPFLAALKARQLEADIAHAIMESFSGGALVILKYIYPQARRILTLQSGDLDDTRKQKQFLLTLVWKKIHTTPHIITAIGSSLAERVRKLGVPDKNIRMTPNGVDSSIIPTDVEKIPKQVFSMGRLSWEKGHDYLLKAWPEVLRAVPDATLVIYGEGNKESEMKKIIDDLKINNTVEIRKAIPHDDFIKEMVKAEIFVLATLAEGLGIVYIEAQACGVPPIGTRVGGVPDVIQDGDNGFLIEPKNSEAIADAIIKLLTDKDLAARLIKRGLETSKKYEWSSITENIDSIYKELLK